VLDTIAVKKFLPSSSDILTRRDIWKPLKRGDFYRYVCNQELDTGLPRLTLTRSKDSRLHLRAEVSLPRWIKGSNSILPNEEDVRQGLERLSEFVADTAGERFAVHDMLVTRVDFTKDFNIAEDEIVSAVRSLSDVFISRYNRTRVNDSTMYFNSEGRTLNRRIAIHGKHREVMSRNGSEHDLERTKGVLRLEISYRTTYAVKGLVKHMRLADRRANQVLTREVAVGVFQEIIGRLGFERLLKSGEPSVLKKLEKLYPPSRVMRLLGFLEYVRTYGNDFYKLPSIRYGRTTYCEAVKDCKRAGIYYLE
jgi:hypothetical protein